METCSSLCRRSKLIVEHELESPTCSVPIPVSRDVARWSPGIGESLDTLLGRVDQAMHGEKGSCTSFVRADRASGFRAL